MSFVSSVSSLQAQHQRYQLFENYVFVHACFVVYSSHFRVMRFETFQTCVDKDSFYHILFCPEVTEMVDRA